ncbi:TnsA endonuclease N-terminal domain-containing protein [Teredinibacter turnerae]|uniref:TnsA endonuclease N-terminal domain-containing protein n=1 Tax=Teredinibacter turnerae TaxID=2426 RepID=UPI00040F3778|nr:TnsA endonuclease N-terminal domain-containing protein [Teredinibacter turnerae]
MLTEIQFNLYLERHGLSLETREYLIAIRNQQASRMVGAHAKSNISSWFFSEKMGRTISTEIRTAERAFVVIKEYDKSVLEIWDQPEHVPIQKRNKKGVSGTTWYTPDFLMLTRSGPVVVEVKDSNAIEKLLKSSPSNWAERSDGKVTYLPAKEYFDSIGLKFEVWIASKELRYQVFNMEMTLRARNYEKSDLPKEKLDAAFEESFFWSLHDLKNRLEIGEYTAIIQAIDSGDLFFDCNSSLFSAPKGCFVVRQENLLQYINEFLGPKIYEDGFLSPISISELPSSAYAQKALLRLEKIKNDEIGRSVRRWKSLVKKGAAEGLSEFQSLIPKWFLAGNRKRKINTVVDTFLINYLLGCHAESQGLSQYRSYIQYRVDAQKAHPVYPPVAKTTFNRRLRAIPPELIARKRGGKRSGNAAAAPSDALERQLKAEIAWQRAAIDHYLADIYLIFFDSGGAPHAMRPWVTAMVDLATGCVLAFSISFLNPSKKSCAKVMRDCVRRHGLLPKEIIVDRGAEFKSVYFSALLAHSKIELVLRPAAHSRYGGEVEGLFGEFKKQWLTQRPGNLADYKEARSVDGKLAPKKHAVLTAFDFFREFEAFISWRDSNPRGVEVEAPRVRLATHMRDYPFVAVAQKFDNEYVLATAVDSKKYKVDPQRGLHIGGMWYWSPEIKSFGSMKAAVEVRVDPENPHTVFALIDNSWCPCYSSRINRYSALNAISQKVEGLIAVEAFGERQKVKQEADEEAVRIIRQLSEESKSSSTSHVIEFESYDEIDSQSEMSVFDGLKSADIRPLEAEAWEVKHVW